MYEAVRPVPDGSATPSRFVSTATRYGYSGVVLLAGTEDVDRQCCDRIAARYGIDVVAGCCVRPSSRKELMASISTRRPDVDVLCVRAGSRAMRRFIVTRAQIDVLVDPIGEDGVIAHTTIKQAMDNGIAIALEFRPLLRERGTARIEYAKRLADLARVLDYYQAPTVVTAIPRSHLELRAPRELSAIGSATGIDASLIHRGFRTWQTIAERSRRFHDDRFIEPGVRRVDE